MTMHTQNGKAACCEQTAFQNSYDTEAKYSTPPYCCQRFLTRLRDSYVTEPFTRRKSLLVDWYTDLIDNPDWEAAINGLR